MNPSIISKLEGLQTIKTVQKLLNVKRSTAIKTISKLRKQGFVDTSGGYKQPRLYKISLVPKKQIGNPGLYDIINKYSPIKLVAPYEHRIINKKLTIEETIIRAILEKKPRVILTSLALFNHVKNWSRLYKYAKEANVRKKVGALYEIARLYIRVKKINKRTYNKLLAAKHEQKYIIPGLKSRSFKDIQKKWKVYIPLNDSDLRKYKE